MDVISMSGLALSAVGLLLAIVFAAKKKALAAAILSLLSCAPGIQLFYELGYSPLVCLIISASAALMCVVALFAHATPWLYPYAGISTLLVALWLMSFNVELKYFLGAIGIVLAIYAILLVRSRKQKPAQIHAACRTCPYAAKCVKGRAAM